MTLFARIGAPTAATLGAIDLKGDAPTYRIVCNGAKGTMAIANLRADMFTYTPRPGTSGGDSFTFRVYDGQQDSNEATVTVHIATTFEFLPLVQR
jgi:hypothetical protein